MSNWQCGVDVYNMQADFIVVGTTWGTGQVNNNCLVSGVNTDAQPYDRPGTSQRQKKKFGLYHYAMGGNPEAEAQFFYRNTSNYWRHGIVALDWEMDDNPAWGNWDWVRRFMAECERLSGGVRPLLYTGPVAGTIPQDIRDRYGLWIAQYANMSPTGYQANPWMIGAYGEAMRQYSGTGVVNTWSPIDLNIFRGDAWQWDLYANPAGDSTPPATPAAPAQPNTPPADTNTGGISHTMQWGETIWGLAVAYNAWPLSAWHTPSGDINRYYVGDVVTYGGGSTTAPSDGVSKVLQYGDTVWDFATAHGYSVSQCSVPSGNINVYYVGRHGDLPLTPNPMPPPPIMRVTGITHYFLRSEQNMTDNPTDTPASTDIVPRLAHPQPRLRHPQMAGSHRPARTRPVRGHGRPRMGLDSRGRDSDHAQRARHPRRRAHRVSAIKQRLDRAA